jgi:hypothetical protein
MTDTSRLGPARAKGRVRFRITVEIGETAGSGDPEITLLVGNSVERVAVARWLGVGGAWSESTVADVGAAVYVRLLDSLVLTSGVQLALPSEG